MAWRKRQKLPTTVQVSLVDDKLVEVFGRRMNMTQKLALQTCLQQEKRKQKYKIPFSESIRLQKWCIENKIEYEGISMDILRLKTTKIVVENFPTITPPRFNLLWKSLFPYQQKGVQIAIQYFKGRLLLADDMGLGKTRQALTIAMYYYKEGINHILVVCPSYLRYHWENSFIDVCTIAQMDVQVIKTAKDNVRSGIVIVSYDMLDKMKNKLVNQFNILIADESHYVKNRKAKRTKALIPITKTVKRVIFLTGTPATNRPVELFAQLNMLQPGLVKFYTHYAKRYCNGHMDNFGYNDRGSSCAEELYWLLKKAFMIRRLKRDVLTDLPPKSRHTVLLEIADKELEDIAKGFKRWKELNKLIYEEKDGSEEQSTMQFERKSLVTDMFRMTAAAKADAVSRWIKDSIASDQPFLFFGYHMMMLDFVENTVKGSVSYIRIDGSTPAEKRQQYVKDFQDGKAKVAILSIMAAGTGLTLTKASMVVFGELYWVPGVMIQAEDRVHRLTQTQPVTIYHLLGKGTLDQHIYPMLVKKLKMLDAVMDQRDDRTLQGETETEYGEEDLGNIII